MRMRIRSVSVSYTHLRMCFIGPCAAKKLEASRRTVRSDVDFVLTFEAVSYTPLDVYKRQAW